MRDKTIGEMAEILFPFADHVIATRADNPRAATPAEIRKAAHRISAEIEDAVDVPSALQRAKKLTGENGVVVVTGSIYIVGEAMRRLGVRLCGEACPLSEHWPTILSGRAPAARPERRYGWLSRVRSFLIFDPLIWSYTIFLGFTSIPASFFGEQGADSA